VNIVNADECIDSDSDVEVAGGTAAPPQLMCGAVTGVLIGFQEHSRAPLVVFPGQKGASAVVARSTQDLQGAHIGRDVVLVFEGGDPRFPIVIGHMSRSEGCGLPEQGGHVEIDVDGKRLVVSAKDVLVLRCGSASITLTRAGKILVNGTYISNRSSGVVRIKGGAIQLN
jgi:hypothetical protein